MRNHAYRYFIYIGKLIALKWLTTWFAIRICIRPKQSVGFCESYENRLVVNSECSVKSIDRLEYSVGWLFQIDWLSVTAAKTNAWVRRATISNCFFFIISRVITSNGSSIQYGMQEFAIEIRFNYDSFRTFTIFFHRWIANNLLSLVTMM